MTGWGLDDLDIESHICKHLVHISSAAVLDIA